MGAVVEMEFATAQDAWEGINEYLFLQEEKIVEQGGTYQGTQVLLYDVILKARRGMVDPDFDFGYVIGYTTQKWNSLVNNYINFDYLDILKGQILAREKKKGQNYNESMLFDNSHNSGKGCLLSLTFSRRFGDLNPTLIFCLRSSEVTKRLLFDLLLIQRIGEYVYGTEQEFGIQLYCPNVYLDVASFTMYDNHKKLKKLMGQSTPTGRIQENVIKTWKKFRKLDPATVTYRSHLRCVEQLQYDENGWPVSKKKSMFAKELNFNFVESDMPEEIITPKEVRSYKRNKSKKKLG